MTKVVHGNNVAPNQDWFEVGAVGFCASGDRLVIEEDQFKSGYECKQCGGSGTVPSTVVGGKAKTCPECDGKGGIIVVPEVSQRRPTTGIVRSAGEQCKVYKVGDGVLFSNFAGFALDLNRASGAPVCLRILHETEVLTKVRGHLELRAISNQREVSSI
jgi:co-chaperonin GroES (HSP10)